MEIKNLITSCPDETVWQAFVEAEREGKHVSRALSGHLKRCETCKKKVHTLANPWDQINQLTGWEPLPDSVEQKAIQPTKKTFDPLTDSDSDWRVPARDLPVDFEPGSLPSIPGLIDLKEVSRSETAVVYSGFEPELNRPMAVKILGMDTPLSRKARQRAMNEASILTRVQLPQVVKIYRTGEVNGLPYLVMEWVSGGTLEEWIQKNETSPRQAARLVRDLAEAVSEVHALGIIHRDLKPANILLAPRNDKTLGFIPKLADFGLARRDGQPEPGKSESGTIAGTPSFMAPEQTGLNPNLGAIGPATDIHGLGAILYALLTQKPPYEGFNAWVSLKFCSEGKYRPIQQLRQGVPRDLRTIVETCLKTEPRDRYRSAGRLADELRRFLLGQPITARPVRPSERFWMWTRRHPLASTLAVLLFLTMSSLAVGYGYYLDSKNKSFAELQKANSKGELALEQSNDSRKRLQKSLGFLTNDVVSRMIGRGQPLNQEDRNFLLKIREEYKDWPIDPTSCDSDGLEAWLARTEGRKRLGDLFYKVNQYEDARDCFEDVLRECDEGDALLLDPEQQTQLDRIRIASLEKMFNVWGYLGGPPEAKATAARGVEEIKARFPPDSIDHLEILRFYQFQAFIGIEETNGSDWEAHFNHSLRLADKFLMTHSDDERVWFAQLRFLYNYGVGNLKLQRVGGQQECFQTLYCLAADAGTKFPKEWIKYRIWEFYALSGLIDSAMASGNPEMARAVVDEKILQIEKALQKAPEDPRLVAALIETAAQNYTICKALKRPHDARTLMETAVSLANDRYLAEPAVYDRCANLMSTLMAYGDLLREANETESALKQAEWIESLARSWLNFEDKTGRAQAFLYIGLDRQIEIYNQLKKTDLAKRKLEEKIRMDSPRERYTDWMRLARLCAQTEDWKNARKAGEEAAKHDKTAIEATGFLQGLTE